ncbi:MAG: ArsR/SmtB family transcription factor [Rhabdochlamydiaceae bacterium]
MNLEDTLQHLKALSSLTRFRILNLLYQSNQLLSQEQLVDALDVSKSNVSRHAKILHNAELILQWKEGRSVHYKLNADLKPGSILDVIKEFQDNPKLKHDLKKLKAKSTKRIQTRNR